MNSFHPYHTHKKHIPCQRTKKLQISNRTRFRMDKNIKKKLSFIFKFNKINYYNKDFYLIFNILIGIKAQASNCILTKRTAQVCS